MPDREPLDARYMSTPMIKGELWSLIGELAPDKHWPKSTQLKDLIEYVIGSFPADTQDPREGRALDLAHVIYNSERR